MNEPTAKGVAEIVGGKAEQTGGNVWAVIIKTDKGEIMLGRESWAFAEDEKAWDVLSSEIVAMVEERL